MRKLLNPGLLLTGILLTGLVALPADAQQLRTGVSRGACSTMGGTRFTATNTAGVGEDVGECYVPPTMGRLPSGAGIAGGGGLSAAGRAAAGLGALAGALGALEGAFGAMGTEAPGSYAPVEQLPYPDAMQDVPDDGQRLQAANFPRGANANPFEGRVDTRVLPWVGTFASPAVQREIAAACEGVQDPEGGALYRACITEARIAALLQYNSTIHARCNRLEDPQRGICALRNFQEMDGLGIDSSVADGGQVCVGDCVDPTSRRTAPRSQTRQPAE